MPLVVSFSEDFFFGEKFNRSHQYFGWFSQMWIVVKDYKDVPGSLSKE